MHIVFPRYPQGLCKALTLSFDDGRLEDRRLVEMFNHYGVKGTFNLNSGILDENRIPQSEYPALYRGHEVASHTVTHPSIAHLNPEQAVQQILEDRRTLEHITKQQVHGFAYPNGSVSRELVRILPAVGIHYGRTVDATHCYDLPEDFLTWNPTCNYREGVVEHGREFAAWDKTKDLFLLYVWGHSYELPLDDGWNQMDQFLQIVSGRSDTWYATNGEIVDYLSAIRRLEFSADCDTVYNPSFHTCWLSVDGTVKSVPGGSEVSLF